MYALQNRSPSGRFESGGVTFLRARYLNTPTFLRARHLNTPTFLSRKWPQPRHSSVGNGHNPYIPARAFGKRTTFLGVGRPSLTGISKTSPEVKARVPEKLKVKLEREAKRRGETTSALIREALESYLSA